eukprot:scaffold1146_cov399-Prasinococcus_capsulatus_cf.AAC.90
MDRSKGHQRRHLISQMESAGAVLLPKEGTVEEKVRRGLESRKGLLHGSPYPSVDDEWASPQSCVRPDPKCGLLAATGGPRRTSERYAHSAYTIHAGKDFCDSWSSPEEAPARPRGTNRHPSHVDTQMKLGLAKAADQDAPRHSRTALESMQPREALLGSIDTDVRRSLCPSMCAGRVPGMPHKRPLRINNIESQDGTLQYRFSGGIVPATPAVCRRDQELRAHEDRIWEYFSSKEYKSSDPGVPDPF